MVETKRKNSWIKACFKGFVMSAIKEKGQYGIPKKKDEFAHIGQGVGVV